jgi:DNA excision repair protein ERCC-1
MVDIPNHEDSLRELSKTSLVNNVTIILCWSAAEAARYLELYKSYEHANFAAIKGQQSSTYAEKLVEFVTIPRGINKADAVALACNFGSLKNAINADQEQIGLISGWGEKKIKKWCSVVEEPFRVKRAAKRKANPSALNADKSLPLGRVPQRPTTTTERPPALSGGSSAQKASQPTTATQSQRPARPDQFQFFDPELDDENEDEEEAMLAAAIEESKRTAEAETAQQSRSSASTSSRTARESEKLSDGIAAALEKLRQGG